MFCANIFSSIANFITDPVETIILAAFLFFIGWAAKRWLVPFLDTQIKLQVATWVLKIADEITDQLRARYPDKDIIKYLDEAVDKLMQVCGVSKEVARRAMEAAFARKDIKK